MPFALILASLCIAASVYLAKRIVSTMQLPRPYTRLGWVCIVGGVLLFPSHMLLGESPSQPNLWGTICMLSAGFYSFLLALTVLKDLIQCIFLRKKKTLSYHRIAGTGILFLAFALTLVGQYKALHPQVFAVQIPIPPKASALQDLRIVQLSDLHITNNTPTAWLEDIVERTNALHPDLIFFTGDIADLTLPDTKQALAPLTKLTAKRGKYAVLGNHEYYRGQADQWAVEMQKSGFVVLQNEHTVLSHKGSKLLIAGTPDNAAESFGMETPNPAKALANAPQDVALKILLSHQPKNVHAAEKAGFDIQLSGHTHGGQFHPWTGIVALVQEFYRGLYAVGQAQLYVNQGTGFWGPAIRLGTTAEITLITLQTRQENKQNDQRTVNANR